MLNELTDDTRVMKRTAIESFMTGMDSGSVTSVLAMLRRKREVRWTTQQSESNKKSSKIYNDTALLSLTAS